MEARVKYFLMNGNRRALIVIIVSFLASDCIQITYASKKMGGSGKLEQLVCFDGQKNSHASAFPPSFPFPSLFLDVIKAIYNQDTDLSIHSKDFCVAYPCCICKRLVKS